MFKLIFCYDMFVSEIKAVYGFYWMKLFKVFWFLFFY